MFETEDAETASVVRLHIDDRLVKEEQVDTIKLMLLWSLHIIHFHTGEPILPILILEGQ